MPGREVLSQEEIDMLLKALSSGELRAEDVDTGRRVEEEAKAYNFRRPNKFSKDQLRTLFMIHDNFSRLTSNFLSAYMRASVQVKVVSVDQVTYEDFLVSIPTPTLLTLFSLPPLKGMAILETSLAFVFPVVDLLFGGEGQGAQRLRELTDIEVGVMRRINGRILEQLAYAWGDLMAITPQIEAMEINPQFNQIISPTETVAVVSFTVSVGQNQALMNLCLPFLTLEDVLGRLTARYWLAAQEETDRDEARARVEGLLRDVELDLSVSLGEARVTVGEFLQLSPGDVISLQTLAGEDLELLVAGVPRFLVQPGLLGQKLAVQVMGWNNQGGSPGER